MAALDLYLLIVSLDLVVFLAKLPHPSLHILISLLIKSLLVRDLVVYLLHLLVNLLDKRHGRSFPLRDVRQVRLTLPGGP